MTTTTTTIVLLLLPHLTQEKTSSSKVLGEDGALTRRLERVGPKNIVAYLFTLQVVCLRAESLGPVGILLLLDLELSGQLTLGGLQLFLFLVPQALGRLELFLLTFQCLDPLFTIAVVHALSMDVVVQLLGLSTEMLRVTFTHLQALSQSINLLLTPLNTLSPLLFHLLEMTSPLCIVIVSIVSIVTTTMATRL